VDSLRATIAAATDTLTDAEQRLAAAYWPYGALLHTELPGLIEPWRLSVDGNCDRCGRLCDRDPLSTLPEAVGQCLGCNTVRCDVCMELEHAMRREVTSTAGGYEWLCPLCTAAWLRRAAGAPSRWVPAAWAYFRDATHTPVAIAGEQAQLRVRVLADHKRRGAAPLPIGCDVPLLVPESLQLSPGVAAPDATTLYRYHVAAAAAAHAQMALVASTAAPSGGPGAPSAPTGEAAPTEAPPPA
jgi:hypothetical protein